MRLKNMQATMTAANEQRKKIHPHKFTLWVAMASIIMAFAALTSAYLVKMSKSEWKVYSLPRVFWFSTVVILLSSGTMYLAEKAFKEKEMPRFRLLITVTAALGVLFSILQVSGFYQVHNMPDSKIIGRDSTASGSFLLVIAGLHILHIMGGVIALLVQFFRAFSRKQRNYSAVPIEITATYWHFVDLLWLYLFIFFSLARP
jgi:cytochrome c oxidase subunit III